LVPGQVTRAVARARDSVFYDVRYTVDSLGFRVSHRGDAPPRSGTCALFLVCSFTFGEGVQDWETLPYRVGELTRGRIAVVNAGVPAYGMEHVVAALEQRTHAPVPPCSPTHIIYQALPQHIVRASGGVKFSRYGPRYALTPAGDLVYRGTSPPPTGETPEGSALWANVAWQLSKARLWRVITERQTPPGSLADLRLYLALVRRARDLFAERYPRAEFHVLAWSIGGFYAGNFETFRDSLARIVPAVHEVRSVLTGYDSAPVPHQIDRMDAHPNARAYDLLARFVVDSILRPGPNAAPGTRRPQL
jgi:hypothetical protein